MYKFNYNTLLDANWTSTSKVSLERSKSSVYTKWNFDLSPLFV